MKKHPIIFLLLTCCLSPISLWGQEPDRDPPRAGFFFFGAPGILIYEGQTEAGIHLGLGAEYRLRDGLGVSADIGYLFHPRAFGSGVGLFSPGVFYQFQRERRTVPFVEGGYTLAFAGGGTLNAVHFGGGVNRWLTENWGLKLQVRNHFPPEFTSLHVLEFRVALTRR